MQLVFLPAYSHDLNPIEEAFSAIKAWIQNNRDYVLGETTNAHDNPYKMIWDAVFIITSREKHGLDDPYGSRVRVGIFPPARNPYLQDGLSGWGWVFFVITVLSNSSATITLSRLIKTLVFLKDPLGTGLGLLSQLTSLLFHLFKSSRSLYPSSSPFQHSSTLWTVFPRAASSRFGILMLPSHTQLYGLQHHHCHFVESLCLISHWSISIPIIAPTCVASLLQCEHTISRSHSWRLSSPTRQQSCISMSAFHSFLVTPLWLHIDNIPDLAPKGPKVKQWDKQPVPTHVWLDFDTWL